MLRGERMRSKPRNQRVCMRDSLHNADEYQETNDRVAGRFALIGYHGQEEYEARQDQQGDEGLMVAGSAGSYMRCRWRCRVIGCAATLYVVHRITPIEL